jgi:4-amino-4-deoxy-L-arabinose transferase-like glycosyltransferase
MEAFQPRSWTGAALFLLAGLALTCGLQWYGNAYTADLSQNPDEAAHFVTGLMSRDYLLHFPWGAPMPFAENFYSAYPMVAIGHWPPLFYLAQALWMTMFGATVTSALLLIAISTAATAAVIVWVSKPRVGVLVAVALGLLFLIAPLVQRYSRGVNTEMPLTLLAVLAALAYARYLSTRRVRDALWFSAAASAAILTKPNGLAIALLPPLAVLLSRQTRIVTERSFWIPPIIVLVVCGPWYVLTARLASDGWSASYDPSWLLQNPVASNSIDTLGLFGVPIFLLACGGAWLALNGGNESASDREQRHQAAALAALALSTWIFVSVIVPVREDRHLLPLMPPMLVFAGIAFQRITGARPAPWRKALAAAVAIIAVAPLGIRAGRVNPKFDAGSAAVAAAIESDRKLDGGVILVSSEGYGEGIFIATLAEKDQRPQHRVLRASQILSSSNWSGSDVQLTYRTEDDVDTALRSMRVAAIVLDSRPAPGPHTLHHQQLLGMLSRHTTHWQALPPSAATRRFTMFRALHDGN